jgi:ubiquinone/menaquinone biosynthesis C-methylase UbiE
MSFTPTHPNWLTGCWDAEMIRRENEDTRAFIHNLVPTPMTALDVGSGSGHQAQFIFPRSTTATLTDVSPTPQGAENNVDYADIRDIPYDDNSFDLVHARRVLSNLKPDDRYGALTEMFRVARHHVIVVDVDLRAHEAIEDLRSESHRWPLSPRDAGRGPVDFSRLPSPAEKHTIGGSYYLWTRWLFPLIQGYDMAKNCSFLRRAVPSFSERAKEEFGVHKLYYWRKIS